MAVVRLRANTDTSVNEASTRRTRKVDTTERAPMARGSAAATTLRKTNSSRIKVMGMAMSSARTRSCSMVSLTWLKTWAKPLNCTSTAP